MKNTILAVSLAALLPSLAQHTAMGAGEISNRPLRIGDRVQLKNPAPVWTAPPIGGEITGNQVAKASGLLAEGPVRAGETWWWRVDFHSGTDGWISERALADAKGAPPAPRLAATLPPKRPMVADAIVSLELPPDGVVNSSKFVLRGKVLPDLYAPDLVSLTLNGRKVALDKSGRFAEQVTLVSGKNKLEFQTSVPNPRQHANQISAYLDGSVIYGSDAARLAALRTFSGGLLKTSEGNLMPLNTAGLANANEARIFPDNELFLAGDVRSNENVELSAIHTLFLREHNLLAAGIAAATPGLTDEQIFQAARKIVVAEMQAITYREFLPALLGRGAIRPYEGYKPDVNPGIATEFSTAAYRIGHTLINDDVEMLDNEGNEIDEALELAEAFFNPSVLHAVGPDPLLKYLATDSAQEVDLQLVGGLRNFLFGPPGAGGFDLAALNIQRGRDHGLSDYNSVRAAYGLPRVTSFAGITANTTIQTKLKDLYGSVDAIDLWIGGLSEGHLPGSSVGPTFQRIIADQFERIRDGDRFWYQWTFKEAQLEAIERTRLSDIIRRNTSLTKIQDDVFFYDSSTLAGLVPKSSPVSPVLLKISRSSDTPPSLDGKLNNPGQSTWGVAGVNLMRFAPAAYADGLSTPAGRNRPNARLISNTLCDSSTSSPNKRNLSDWIYGWGQFLDHDLDLTTSGDTAFDIAVPTGDPYFDPRSTGSAFIYMNRSIYDSASGTATPVTRRQTVSLTVKTPPPTKPKR
ncbi:MAG: hypothetical protein RL630_857 [Verrucomicrobiota bacterium]|jgi:hypothetical protein